MARIIICHVTSTDWLEFQSRGIEKQNNSCWVYGAKLVGPHLTLKATNITLNLLTTEFLVNMPTKMMVVW